MAEALKFLGIFFVTLASVKLGIGLFCMWRDSHGTKEG